MNSIMVSVSLMVFFLSLLIFSQCFHPLLAALLLMFMTFGISLFLASILNIWFFLSLMLIFLGGMMVIFLYVTTLSSNDKLILSNSMVFKKTSFFIFILVILWPVSLNLNPPLSLFYELNSSYLLIYLTLYLLLTLLVTTKISEKFKGNIISWF